VVGTAAATAVATAAAAAAVRIFVWAELPFKTEFLAQVLAAVPVGLVATMIMVETAVEVEMLAMESVVAPKIPAIVVLAHRPQPVDKLRNAVATTKANTVL
jgi:hypothetical protein